MWFSFSGSQVLCFRVLGFKFSFQILGFKYLSRAHRELPRGGGCSFSRRWGGGGGHGFGAPGLGGGFMAWILGNGGEVSGRRPEVWGLDSMV